MIQSNYTYLVADIGGTNARFALADEAGNISAIQVLAAEDYPQFSDALQHYLDTVDGQNINSAAIAVAAPVHQASFGFANSHWQIDKQAIEAMLNCSAVRWMNDFEAQAWGVLTLNQERLVEVKPGSINNHGNKLVLGPGTGIGIAGLVESTAGWVPVVGEGGHAAFGPTNELEIAVHSLLLQQCDYVAWENLISGSGLPLLYKTLAQVLDEPVQCHTGADISQAAFRQQPEPLAQQTMQIFFRQLGHICASSAFIMGATGGVYLTGGILPKLRNELLASEFVSAFTRHPLPRDYLADMPVYLNLDEHLGLRGAAKILIFDEQS